MNKKILCCLLVALCVIMLFSACGGSEEPEGASQNVNEGGNSTMPYISTLHEDGSYTFADSRGNILYSSPFQKYLPRELQVSDHVYQITFSSGPSLSLRYSFFYDAEKEVISEIYDYVLGSDGEYVVCASYQNGQCRIVVSNIFDPDAYSKTYVLLNTSTHVDFATGCEFQADGSAEVTYLVGENYEEATVTLEIP